MNLIFFFLLISFLIKLYSVSLVGLLMEQTLRRRQGAGTGGLFSKCFWAHHLWKGWEEMGIEQRRSWFVILSQPSSQLTPWETLRLEGPSDLSQIRVRKSNICLPVFDSACQKKGMWLTLNEVTLQFPNYFRGLIARASQHHGCATCVVTQHSTLRKFSLLV